MNESDPESWQDPGARIIEMLIPIGAEVTILGFFRSISPSSTLLHNKDTTDLYVQWRQFIKWRKSQGQKENINVLHQPKNISRPYIISMKAEADMLRAFNRKLRVFMFSGLLSFAMLVWMVIVLWIKWV